MIVHVVSVSSGKDSTATLLLAIERYGRERCRFVFADTGNEHEAVYEYLAYLEQALDIVIDRLKASFADQIAGKRMFIARDARKGRRNGRRLRWTNKAKRRALAILHPTGNPYLDLCLWKGRFPSRKRQFCTQELKTGPLVEYQMALMDSGCVVVSWQGVRRDESANRRDAQRFEELSPGLFAWRPIVDWTAQQTVDFVRSRGLVLNPLYSQGMGRVGCMPCINARKSEISQIANRFPEHVKRIAEWEALVTQASKTGGATFFHSPNPVMDRPEDHGILQMVEWSRTTRGGRQYDLLKPTDTEVNQCSSAYGLCE